jgi:carboxymethylenebutenolidase
MNAPSPDAIRAETITITGHGGDAIEAYRAMPIAEPLAGGSRGGIVWIHHMPGYGHTVNIDVINPGLGPSARVALELTEESALALADAIRNAIAHAPAGLASKDQ